MLDAVVVDENALAGEDLADVGGRDLLPLQLGEDVVDAFGFDRQHERSPRR